MTVCKYFLQGNCRFGDRCRFEHPGKSTQASQNRYGALQNPGSNDSRKGADNWNFTTQDIKDELTAGKGRPNWILSAYGPGKNAPASLLQDLEWSPEELRVEFYKQAALGNPDAADQQAIQTWNNALKEIKNVYDNAHKVLDFMKDADSQQKRPSRYDMCSMDGRETVEQFKSSFSQSSQAGSSSTPFGGGGGGGFGKPAFGKAGFGSSPSSSSPFGQQPSSTFGQPSAPSFGSGVFGKPTAAATAFGQPAFGSTGFGQEKKNPFAPASASSGFGAQGASTFGQPSQPSSAFGQPSQTSPFGQAAQQQTPAFGQPSQPTSAFGQPSKPASTFGQPSQPTSTFGQPSQPTSTFGQPSQPTSTFGQPSQPSSAFGQPSQIPAFGQPSQPSSAFGQASQPGPAFGQPSQPSAFGSAFGKPSQPASGFGQPSQLSSGFGQTGFGTSPGTAAFGAGAFGKTEGSTNAFEVKVDPSATTTKDQDMDAASASTEPSSTAVSNPFAKPQTSAFGTPQPLPPPAAAAAAPQAESSTVADKPLNPSPLAATTTTTRSSAATQPLSQGPSAAVIYAQTLPSVPPQKDRGSGRLTSYRGQRVTYIEEPREHDQFGNERPATYYPCYVRPDDGAVEKIWFPDGAGDEQVVPLNRDGKRKDLEADDDEYTDQVKEMYEYLKREGAWRGGKVPLVPPMRSWVDYDF